MPWLTITQAAARYPLSASQIRRLAAAGLVERRQIGPIWQVDAADLARYLATRKRGRPPKSH
jgi:hypothetical protein